jgi:hypothetical protein
VSLLWTSGTVINHGGKPKGTESNMLQEEMHQCFTCMSYLYQQVCSIFKFESFNTTHQAFHSIINEKKDVFVNLTTGAGNHLFITPLPKLFDVIFGFKIFKQIVNL